MYPFIPLFGGIRFNAYGFFILLGCIAFWLSIQKDRRFHTLFKSVDQLSNLLCYSIFFGFAGGRIWYILLHPSEFNGILDYLAVWDGGLSVLGGFVVLMLAVPLMLRYMQIPVMPAVDLASVHLPLMYSISRIGCFMAGCCYGIGSSSLFAVYYTHPESLAPLHCWIHPTQLYSAITLGAIYILMRKLEPHAYKFPGFLFGAFLVLTNLERFMNEWWRAEYAASVDQLGFTNNQYLAILLVVTGILINLFSLYRSHLHARDQSI